MALKAGELNRRIFLQMPVRAPNGRGGFTKGWSAPRPVRAKMVMLKGDEALQHNLVRKRQVWRVTLRYWPDIDVECRATYRGEVLAITSCDDPDGKRERIEMICETGVPA
ncbi:MAG: hypothetical protein DI606_04405 [Sphingobium sp.]|uniref:phage head closure protein n=1 Tax=Sphingobium sp. TaxID=1912891 RepID=UPI000DB21B2C|nr:phage head closure protein [Sphingobium sp.]PZU13813.1 MAG: hypothetical protein DI606_04405 [Sphingobium sp.]